MENFSQEQLLGYIKKQKARIKQLETENESLLNQNKNLEIENNQFKNSAKSIGGVESSTNITIEPQSESKIPAATPSTTKGTVNKALLNSCINMVLDKSHLAQSQYKLQSSFFKWKASYLLHSLEVSQKNLEVSKEATAQSEVKINKLKTLLARTHHSKQVCTDINC